MKMDGKDAQYNLVGLPMPLGSHEGIILRTYCRIEPADYYGFALRIRFLDHTMDFHSPTRAIYLPIIASGDGPWSKVLFVNAKQPGEEGFALEVLCWPSKPVEPGYPRGSLIVEEIRMGLRALEP